MISFTDVLHDLVRRGLTLRIDPEGNLFIYEPPRAPAPAERTTATTGTAAAEGTAAPDKPQNGVRMQILDSLEDEDPGMSARHTAALAARCRRPLIPAAGMPAPLPPGPEWRGITWRDVPGHDEHLQKLNFALLKRGMLNGHKCCRSLEGEALKQRLQELTRRNRDNSRRHQQAAQQRKLARASAPPHPHPP